MNHQRPIALQLGQQFLFRFGQIDWLGARLRGMQPSAIGLI